MSKIEITGDLNKLVIVLGLVSLLLFVWSELSKNSRERLLLSKDSKIASALSDAIKLGIVLE